MTSTIRLTAGLLGFEQHNCDTCQHHCDLEAAAISKAITAPELRIVGNGDCPYHQNFVAMAEARHSMVLPDMTKHHVRDGAALLQRIVVFLH
jgi:hypothetical protein